MFQSIITPVVPLLAIKFACLTSRSVITFLISELSFPVSGCARVFLITVLFKVKASCYVLLLDHFGRRLSCGRDATSTVITACQGTNHAMFFDNLTIVVNFTTVNFSRFVLCRSTTTITVNMTVLLVTLFAVIPFFVTILKRGVF